VKHLRRPAGMPWWIALGMFAVFGGFAAVGAAYAVGQIAGGVFGRQSLVTAVIQVAVLCSVVLVFGIAGGRWVGGWVDRD